MTLNLELGKCRPVPINWIKRALQHRDAKFYGEGYVARFVNHAQQLVNRSQRHSLTKPNRFLKGRNSASRLGAWSTLIVFEFFQTKDIVSMRMRR